MRSRHVYLLKCCWLLLLVAASYMARAEHPDSLKPSSPPKLVNDFAKALWYYDVTALENKLVKYDKESSNQIAIVTINSLSNYDIADFAVKLANKWGIGNKGKDNGVLILLAMYEQEVTISVGRGLEGRLTDYECKQIIENEIVPSFKENNIAGGLDKGVDAIIQATKGEYKGDKNYYKRLTSLPRWAIILLLIVGINGAFFGIGALVDYLRYKITGKRRVRKEYSHSSASSPQEDTSQAGNSSSSSSGGENEQFGGYGGGRFGGGGASGKW